MKCPPLNSYVPIKLKQTHEYKRGALKLRPIKRNGCNRNFADSGDTLSPMSTSGYTLSEAKLIRR